MGKSRLVWELYRELDERPGIVASWRQGRALAYGGGAFDALADVLRAEIGALETDGPGAATGRLADALAVLSDDEGEQRWLLRALEPLLGRGEGLSQDEGFGAWQRFFELVAENRPLVLVLEDLHWADDGTLDFSVDHLADWSTDSPLLVLCTARPELFDRRPLWGGGRLNSQTISLAPLDDTATAELLAQALGSPLVDADVQQTLLAQAGGNPLYAEEFARMIAETGNTDDVPATVQGLIAARLDVLPPGEKALLQDASVLGKVFWRGGVEALGNDVSDDILVSLTRRELLRRARASTVGGETEFAFRHALVRDVAYGQIPRAARADKHRRAAEWIAATAPTRADLVAHHYLEALELTDAAGGDSTPLRDPARAALTAAGDRARSLGALGDALALYRRALTLAPDNPIWCFAWPSPVPTPKAPPSPRARQAMALYEQAGDGGRGRAGRRRSRLAASGFSGDAAGAQEAMRRRPVGQARLAGRRRRARRSARGAGAGLYDPRPGPTRRLRQRRKRSRATPSTISLGSIAMNARVTFATALAKPRRRPRSHDARRGGRGGGSSEPSPARAHARFSTTSPISS